MKTIIELSMVDIKELIMKEYHLTNKDAVKFIITHDYDMRGEECGHKIMVQATIEER